MSGVRHWHFNTAHATDGAVQIVKALLHNLSTDFSRQAAGAPALIDNQRAVSPGHRCQHGRHVERAQGTQINDLDADTSLGEAVGRLQTFPQ
jgi:hypothetical protein